jgi:hypothetical protein
MTDGVFRFNLNSLTGWLEAQDASDSEVIQAAIADAMEQGGLPAVPVEEQKAGVRLHTDARQWLQSQANEHGLEAEADAVRACLAQVVVDDLLAKIEHYKSDQASTADVEAALWLALGYTPTKGGAGTASSQADKGDP